MIDDDDDDNDDQAQILDTVEVVVRALEREGIGGNQFTMLAFHSLAARFVVLLGMNEAMHVDLARAAFSDAMRDHGEAPQ